MKYWHGTLLSLTLTVSGWSEENQLQKVKFTDVVNDVNVTSVDKKAVRAAKVNDSFEVPEVVKTGTDSRAELQADDKTITRVGSNTIFSFDKDKRTINLESGSVLFHSPKGMGGGTIKTAAATAAVTGTTIMVGATSNGGFKLLVLEGKSRVTMANGRVQNLQGGQMTFIVPGATTPTPVITFRLGSQTEGSKLVNGFDQPLASLPKIQEVTARQEKMITSGHMEGTQLVVGDAKDRKGAQVIDATLLQNRVSSNSFEALATYLDRRFKVDFTIFGEILSGEVFKSFTGANGVFEGHQINTNGENFAVFAARRLTLNSASGDVNLSFANGFSTAALVSRGDLEFKRGVNFAGFGKNLHIESFDGRLLFPDTPATLQEFRYDGAKMGFKTHQDLSLNGGTVLQKLKFTGQEVSFRASHVMNIRGVEFNSSKILLDGDTVNLFNVNFGTAPRVDIKTRTGTWFLSGTDPTTPSLSNGAANLKNGGSLTGTAASGYDTLGSTSGSGKVNSSEIYVSAGGGQ